MSQLENIGQTIEKISKAGNLIEEIGMRLEYGYKMKCLILFIKPKDAIASHSNKIIWNLQNPYAFA